MRSLMRAFWVLSTLALTGCVSWISSEKVDDTNELTAEGIRYSLPQPFLLVTPKPDGTVDVERIMLPDTNKTYTIRQPSFVASHTLNVELDQRMLKSIDLNADTGVTTSKAIEGLGEVRKAAFDAEAAQEKSATDKAAAAKKRVADAELAVAKYEAVVKFLEPDKNNLVVAPKYFDAQIALQQAQAELDAARSDAQAMGIEGFNIPGGNAPTMPTAYGPMLYRIEQSGPDDSGAYTVNLVAVTFPALPGGTAAPQLPFSTSKIALPPEEQPAKFAFDPAADILVGEEQVIETTTTVAVKEIDTRVDKSGIYRIEQGQRHEVGKPAVTKSANGRKLKIGVPKNLPVADYTVVLSLKIGEDPDFTSHDFTLMRR